MKVNGIPTRTIRALDNGSAIEIIDQTLLPYRFEKRILSDWRDGVEAIETMRVRGAPLIGIAGAWSVVLAVKENPENGPLLAAAERIQCARPTAVNLVWAVQKMLTALLPREPSQRFDTAVKLAAQLTQEDVDTCRAIGDMGCSLIASVIKRFADLSTSLRIAMPDGWPPLITALRWRRSMLHLSAVRRFTCGWMKLVRAIRDSLRLGSCVSRGCLTPSLLIMPAGSSCKRVMLIW